MYKLTAWVKEKGTPVRYIRQAETVSELWAEITFDIDLTDILELHITKEI